MNFFGDAMKMFTGFAPPGAAATPPASAQVPAQGNDLDELKRQMLEMQARLEQLARK